jgi:hypothetical protein
MIGWKVLINGRVPNEAFCQNNLFVSKKRFIFAALIILFIWIAKQK